MSAPTPPPHPRASPRPPGALRPDDEAPVHAPTRDTSADLATHSWVRGYAARLSGANVLVLIAVLGVMGTGGKSVLGWLVRDAVAQDGGVAAVANAVVVLDKRVTVVEQGQSELRALMIRQLEEGRANAVWVQTGRKPEILNEPLPGKDGGR